MHQCISASVHQCSVSVYQCMQCISILRPRTSLSRTSLKATSSTMQLPHIYPSLGSQHCTLRQNPVVLVLFEFMWGQKENLQKSSTWYFDNNCLWYPSYRCTQIFVLANIIVISADYRYFKINISLWYWYLFQIFSAHYQVGHRSGAVSYTHLTLPTNREV